jgi:hypothetical protein
MSNLYSLFVNPNIVSYISSEYITNKKLDITNQGQVTKVQQVIKKVLDETYSLLDKSKISKNNVNDAIEKFVNVTLKRLDLPPKQRNMAAPVMRQMPAQYSANTRMNNGNESLDNRVNKYMENYREFAHSTKPNDVPDWLRGMTTNPKRMADEQLKNSSKGQLDNFKATSTRPPQKQYNSSQQDDTNEIADFGGSTNFSYFNDTPEIESAFDEAFYTTGIDPDKINEDSETLDARLQKMEAMRGTIAAPEKKIENIHELFNENQNITVQNMQQRQVSQQVPQQRQAQQQMQQQIQQMQQQKAQQQAQQQGHQQAQQQIQQMYAKVVKYEEYLKTLMAKYTELKEERDELKLKLKEKFEGNTNKFSTDVLDEKKKELIRLSNEVQEKIRRYEEMQEANANVDD